MNKKLKNQTVIAVMASLILIGLGIAPVVCADTITVDVNDGSYVAAPQEILQSIEKGLSWLVTQQNQDGSWGEVCPNCYDDRVAYTAFAVVKLEDRAFELGMSPFAQAYEYSQQVINGLNYIFSGQIPMKIKVWVGFALKGVIMYHIRPV